MIAMFLAYPFSLAFLKIPSTHRWICLVVVIFPMLLYVTNFTILNPNMWPDTWSDLLKSTDFIVVITILPLTVWLASIRRAAKND